MTTEKENNSSSEENDSPETEPTDESISSQAGDETMDQPEDGELPEYEPLTPELVEDEAIRGDFMIRWAVVLLAFLLACVPTVESAVLTHISAGQTIIANGYWPPASDTLSSTANGLPWYNLSWLFDLTLAVLYNVAGPIGITLAKAILVALAFWAIGQTSLRGISTWWGSICSTLALLACYPWFSAMPAIITICGMAILLYLLMRWQETGFTSIPWGIVGLIWVWSNLDPRMYLGLSALILFVLGQTVNVFLKSDVQKTGVPLQKLWLVLGLSVVAAILHPFLWRSLLAPISIYGSELPAGQSLFSFPRSIIEVGSYPILSAVFWRNLNHASLAGLMLIVTATVAMFLNRSRLDWGYLFVYAGFVGFSLLSSRDLAPASIVCVVLATLNAQDWYRNNFRQTYSVDVRELFFTRGGRAVTVIALTGLGYLAVASRLNDSPTWKIGFGFHESLQNEIDAIDESVADSFDDHPFHFRVRQGDLLIWVGKKSFVDSRLPLFLSNDESSILQKFLVARKALLPPLTVEEAPKNQAEADARSQKWKDVLNEYDITWAITSLSGKSPNYFGHLGLLLQSNDWRLTDIAPFSSTFCRVDLPKEDLAAFTKGHSFNFVERAFKVDQESKDVAFRTEWAQPATFYQTYFTNDKTPLPNPIREAIHYREYFRMVERKVLEEFDLSLSTALCHLIIRNVNQGLASNPQHVEGYRALAAAYETLRQNEFRIAQMSGGRYPNDRRYFQSIQALSQAMVIAPNHLPTHRYLLNIYVKQHRCDLVLRELARIEQIRNTMRNVDVPDDVAENEAALRQTNEARTSQIRQLVEDNVSKSPNFVAAANLAYRYGCVLYAMELLERDPQLTQKDPRAQLLRAILLIESGQGDEASQVLGQMEGVAEQLSLLDWRTPAALSSLGLGDYERASSIWTKDALEAEQNQISAAMQTLPLVGRSGWPLTQTRAAFAVTEELPRQSAQQWLNVALNSLETGETGKAAEHLRHVLEIFPETEFRPMVQFYLYQVSGQMIDLAPPSDWIPVADDLYPDPNRQTDEDSKSESMATEKTDANSKPAVDPLSAPLPVD